MISKPKRRIPLRTVFTASGQSKTAPVTIHVEDGAIDFTAGGTAYHVPVPNGAQFNSGVNALWSAVVTDDPRAAMLFFFPLTAYQQVKAISDPASDWQHRLVAAYARDVHALHLSLGPNASQAQLVGIDVPQSQARWITPGVEYNKIGYWRVYGTRIRYMLNGRTQSFAVASLISWRGEWYVVHLSSIS